jgi:hypothetical protein
MENGVLNHTLSQRRLRRARCAAGDALILVKWNFFVRDSLKSEAFLPSASLAALCARTAGGPVEGSAVRAHLSSRDGGGSLTTEYGVSARARYWEVSGPSIWFTSFTAQWMCVAGIWFLSVPCRFPLVTFGSLWAPCENSQPMAGPGVRQTGLRFSEKIAMSPIDLNRPDTFDPSITPTDCHPWVFPNRCRNGPPSRTQGVPKRTFSYLFPPFKTDQKWPNGWPHK